MDILRKIDVFDNKTERLVTELNIESFELNLFKKRFDVKEQDPLMYNCYQITSSTVDLFPNITFEFEKYSYYVVCYQV